MQFSKQVYNLLERRYLNKNEKGEVIEKPKELFERVSKNIASAEKVKKKRKEYKKKFKKIMTELKFLPNSPTLMNAGTKIQQLAACFVLPIPDSMEGIYNAIKQTSLIHKSGGGTGFSFSRLRPKGDIVKSTGGVSSGPITFMETLNTSTGTVKQGGRRRGANMGSISVHHPDLLSFINSKKELNQKHKEVYDNFKKNFMNSELAKDEKMKLLANLKQELLEKQLENFNLSIEITEDFMKALMNREEYNIINPRNNKVVKKISAPLVFNKIAKNVYENGEPGLLFIDEINNKHPLNKRIEGTNPCGEVPLLPFECCNLGSINLAKFVKDRKVLWEELKETICIAVRFLDNVIDVNKYPLEEIEEQVKKYRKIGLGVMGFHEFLIKLNVAYNSEEGVKKAEEIMKFINETAHLYSEKLAEEKGAFPAFEENIAKKIKKPRRNVTLTAIAPTGSISFIAGTSGGIEPFYDFEYTHTDSEDNTSKLKYDFTKKADKEVLVTSLEIDLEWHIKIQSVFQKFVDNAVSKTINLPETASIKDIKKAYLLAYELKCKGITIYRNNSRNKQVLNNDKNNSEHNKDNEVNFKGKINPKVRPKITKGETLRYNTGCGKLYLTINTKLNTIDFSPLETFLTTGSDGGCQVMTEAVSRLISLALRSNVSVESIIDQLNSTSICPSFMYQKGKNGYLKGKSCPDIVSRALKYISSKNKQIKKNKSDNLCPICSSFLVFEEGCSNCKECGYTKCK